MEALRKSVAGLSLLVVSKRDKEFWAARATAILGSVEDEAAVRQLLVASGQWHWPSAVAVANELDRCIALAAVKAWKSTAKQRVVDFKELLEKLTAKLGCSIPSSLIPPIKMVSRLKNGEFVELQEFKFSDGQSWAATRTTTVSGDTVEILVDTFSVPEQKSKYGITFVPADEAVVPVAADDWLCDCDGEFLRLTRYLAEVVAMAATANRGAALCVEAAYRRPVPARIMADEDIHLDETLFRYPRHPGELSLGVCAVDCVWSCILGCKKSEEGFIINFNGVGHLLECLEVGPRVLKRQITLRSGVKLLLDLLVREQRSMGAVNGDGTIKDVNRPWNPTVLSASTSQHGASMGSSENCSDTNSGRVDLAPPGVVFHVDDMYDMRMRIYCLLSIVVGFDPPADIGERLVMSSTESLQSSTGMRDDVLRRETLTREERQQLEAIRLYPELRELELWQEIHATLAAVLQDLSKGTSSGVGPLTVGDRKWIEDSIAEHLTRTCWVKNSQKQMVLAEEKAEFEDMLLSIGNQVSAESMGSIPA
ncbi:hypothetical protein FOZ61_005605 [Perkinsus olseni]|uniref:Cilia- and flagella-associated protein 69 ARM repeats domain-containing protein n=1 Tax=Perkinsus olseni TaxID=32597 RepID=A0A7J6LNY9_PEROL|nr:hypothetical protein FOZ61_005605 [Perkinsus olseni]KAF4660934.1 hypothetical protein FOL46_005940 [Perkinsus olseni]